MRRKRPGEPHHRHRRIGNHRDPHLELDMIHCLLSDEETINDRLVEAGGERRQAIPAALIPVSPRDGMMEDEWRLIPMVSAFSLFQ